MSAIYDPRESSAPARDEEVSRLRVPPHSVEAEQSAVSYTHLTLPTNREV